MFNSTLLLIVGGMMIGKKIVDGMKEMWWSKKEIEMIL